MYKVMIVDDEVYVVSLIEKIIDWNILDMTVVGTASNGRQALDVFDTVKPDIVIVDVRMPGYDGIEMMQKIREQNNEVRFIVISGHKKFEYAKSALKYNVEDYLLKPINKEELEGILSSLKEKLDTERAERDMLVTMDTQLDTSRERVRFVFMERFVNGQSNWSNTTIEQQNKEYYTFFQPGNFLSMVLKIDCEYKMDAQFSQDLLENLALLLQKKLQPLCFEISYIQQGYRCLYLLNYSPSTYPQIIQTIQTTLEEMITTIAKYEKVWITLGTGNEKKQHKQAEESLQQANEAIDTRFSLGKNRLIIWDEVKTDPGTLKIVLSDKHREKLMEEIKSFEISKIQPEIEQLFQQADEYKKQHPPIYQHLAKAIHYLFYEYIVQIEVCKDNYDTLQAQLLKKMESCCTTQMMIDVLMEHMSGFIEKYSDDGKNGENPAVRIAKRYIIENFDKNITLSSMAEIVNLSPVYFSILFKKEVGVNFLDYLNQYRITNAKKLLKNVQHNVNEVASMCGFQDARYFSKTFKKAIGITPSEYKNRHTSH